MDKTPLWVSSARSGCGMMNLALVALSQGRYADGLWAIPYAQRDIEYAMQRARHDLPRSMSRPQGLTG